MLQKLAKTIQVAVILAMEGHGLFAECRAEVPVSLCEMSPVTWLKWGYWELQLSQLAITSGVCA